MHICKNFLTIGLFSGKKKILRVLYYCGVQVIKIMRVNNISFGAKINSIPNIQSLAGKSLSVPEIHLNGYTAMIGCDVFTPSCKIAKHDLLFKDKKIIAIDDFDEKDISSNIDYAFLNGKIVTPAIFDEHIHGGYGVSFHNSSEQEIRGLLKRLAQEGTGAVIATTLPGSAKTIRNQIKVLNNIIKNPDEGAAKIYGIHLEGPFLSEEKKGIHSVVDLMTPTIQNYESFEPENVKIVTLAPELDKGFKLTKYLQERGVIVSAGHSTASAEKMIRAGIKQVTHLFNAMAAFHHREPTIANEGLNNPEVTAEMLADQYSLAPETMNMIMKLKPKSKLVLISDALPNAGIKENFIMGGKVIYVDDNLVPRDIDKTLAGNMKFLHNVAKILIKLTNMSFKDFVRYACINPAKNLGVINDFKIKENLEPNFSIWDKQTITPEKTFIK